MYACASVSVIYHILEQKKKKHKMVLWKEHSKGVMRQMRNSSFCTMWIENMKLHGHLSPKSYMEEGIPLYQETGLIKILNKVTLTRALYSLPVGSSRFGGPAGQQ